MALTANHVNNELIKFRTRVAATDFLRSSRFDPYMGADFDLSDRADERPCRRRQGNPRSPGHATDRVPVSAPVRCAATRSRSTATACRCGPTGPATRWPTTALSTRKVSFSIRSTARSLLSGWSRRVVRDDLIDALLSIPTATHPGQSADRTGQSRQWPANGRRRKH